MPWRPQPAKVARNALAQRAGWWAVEGFFVARVQGQQEEAKGREGTGVLRGQAKRPNNTVPLAAASTQGDAPRADTPLRAL